LVRLDVPAGAAGEPVNVARVGNRAAGRVPLVRSEALMAVQSLAAVPVVLFQQTGPLLVLEFGPMTLPFPAPGNP
jgi:hypothetical protein